MHESKMYVFPRVNYTIPLEADFRNEKGVKVRHRFSEGEQSLFPKEQSKDAPKGYLYVSMNPMPISDPLIQEFLDLSIANGANIKHYEPVKIAQKQNEEVFLTVDAMYLVRKAELNDIIPVAYSLLGRGISGKSPEEIIALVMAYAQEKPQEVIEAFDMKATNKVRFFVAEALGQGILEESYDSSEVKFQDNVMTSIGKGEDAVTAVMDYFETKEGKADHHLVAQALAAKMKGVADKEVKAKTTETAKAKETVTKEAEVAKEKYGATSGTIK